MNFKLTFFGNFLDFKNIQYHIFFKNINKMNLSSIGSITTIGITESKITKKFSSLCKNTKGKFYVIKEIGFCMIGIKK